MNRRKFIWGMYTLLLLAMCFVMVSCEFGSAFDENFQIEQYPEGSKKNPINLTVHKWTNKEIISVNSGGTGVQWFSFVATDTTQYIYAKLSTISGLDVYLYDSDFNQIGSRLSFTGSSGSVRNAMYSLTVGSTYFVKIEGYYSDYTGSYWVTFNETGNEPF